jgi:hypothetical protein
MTMRTGRGEAAIREAGFPGNGKHRGKIATLRYRVARLYCVS